MFQIAECKKELIKLTIGAISCNQCKIFTVNSKLGKNLID